MQRYSCVFNGVVNGSQAITPEICPEYLKENVHVLCV